MDIDIVGNDLTVNFAPSTVAEEIIQNVKTICTTPKYSVPLDREFGIDGTALDRPTPKAMALIRAELAQAIRKYEPRCKVKRIDFDADINGKLSVLVRISI